MDIASIVKGRLSTRGRRGMFKHMAGQALLAVCQRKRRGGIRCLRGCCCCNCRHHLVDRSHPLTDGRPITHRRGWICAAPEMGYTSGWGRHGLCECHELRGRKPRGERKGRS